MVITRIGPEAEGIIFANTNDYLVPPKPPEIQQELPPPDLGTIATAEAAALVPDT